MRWNVTKLCWVCWRLCCCKRAENNTRAIHVYWFYIQFKPRCSTTICPHGSQIPLRFCS